METNQHHLHWMKRDFNGDRVAAQLRNHHRSHIEMPVTLHNELHAQIPPIHIPGRFVAMQALESLNGNRLNTVDSTRKLIDDMNVLGAQYHTDAYEMAEHLTLQMPFLLLSVESLRKRCV